MAKVAWIDKEQLGEELRISFLNLLLLFLVRYQISQAGYF
jgi:hypothetical protein